MASLEVRTEFYRDHPGDVGIEDMILPMNEDYEAVTSEALLSYSSNPTVAENLRPNYARISQDGSAKVLMTLKAAGDGTIEKI